MVDAEEETNGHNARSQEQKTTNIKWEYDWLLSIYYAKLDGMLWNCSMI